MTGVQTCALPICKADYKTIKILFGLSVLILILSAINFINLKTAQGSQRAKEVGVKKAIGSTKTQLIFQFLVEATLICVFSYFFSLVLVDPARGSLSGLGQRTTPFAN